MDNKGILIIENILIMGLSIIIIFSIVPQVFENSELNTCMAAVRSGIFTGAEIDSLAVYPELKFQEYGAKHPRLKGQSTVKFCGLTYKNQGYNPVYKKDMIQIKIYASAPSINDARDRDCVGDRLNFYARKSICEAFKTENLTNNYYNPAYSDNYIFTTCEVEWI